MAVYGTINVPIKGVAEIRAKMEGLRKDLRFTMLVSIAKRALRKPLAVAERFAPVGGDYWSAKNAHPGRLKASFTLSKVKSTALTRDIIEVRLQNNAYYSYWVEHGHRIVTRSTGAVGSRRKGQKTVHGKTRPSHFMKKTFESAKITVPIDIEAEIKLALIKRKLI